MEFRSLLLHAGRSLTRVVRFALRHPWSLGLSLAASYCFVELASEMREGELEGWDRIASEYVIAWRGRADALMLSLTHFGSGPGLLLVSAAAFLASLWRKRHTEAVFIIVGAGGTGFINLALKLGFARARPDGAMLYLIETPSSFSFPSGHAMGSAGVLATLVVVAFASGVRRRYRVAVALLAGLCALGVALSRVYFGVHYPSDVLGGQLAAAAWVSAVTGVFYPRLLPGEQATEQTHEAVVEATRLEAEPQSPPSR